MQIQGRFIYGLNYTFMVTCSYKRQSYKASCKPLQGEFSLWNFPVQTLAKREVAAYLISECLGWDLVPPTVLRIEDAPLGPGSLQFFIEHDPDHHYFKFSSTEKKKLPQVALFDSLTNNADRKAGHLLTDPDGELWLIDHGLSFHEDDKHRTVIWDHAGQSILKDLLADTKRMRSSLSEGDHMYKAIEQYLTEREIKATQERAKKLLTGRFPSTPEDRRVYPWPLV